jgi:hypothetical protein
LALFLTEGVFRYYRLPLDFEPLVIVMGRFHLKPLLPLITSDGLFHVLAISQNEIRLLQCTRHRVGEVALGDVPDRLAEVLKWDDPERRLQFHTSTPAPGGVRVRFGLRKRRPAIFHGHGVASADDPKDYIFRHFRRVDEGLKGVLGTERAPLVLAGVDYLHPIYRTANTYPHLVDEGIEGNAEELRASELHEQAWAIVEPLFVAKQQRAADRYRQLAGAGSAHASSELEEVVRAATYGRVETLFVAVGEQRWGTFDPASNEVDAHESRRPADQDLVDFAAIQTLLHGGDVYATESGDVPSGTALAATFRY